MDGAPRAGLATSQRWWARRARLRAERREERRRQRRLDAAEEREQRRAAQQARYAHLSTYTSDGWRATVQILGDVRSALGLAALLLVLAATTGGVAFALAYLAHAAMPLIIGSTAAAILLLIGQTVLLVARLFGGRSTAKDATRAATAIAALVEKLTPGPATDEPSPRDDA